jgi:hypothetical protein
LKKLFSVKIGKIIKDFENVLVCQPKNAILGNSCVSPRQGHKHKIQIKMFSKEMQEIDR